MTADRYEERLRKLRRRMAETGTALVALGPSSHMQWLSGIHPHPDERPTLLLVAREKAAVLMPALNAEAARAESRLPFYAWSDAQGPSAALAAMLDDMLPGRSGLVALDETMRADFALLLLGMMPQARHSFTDDTVGHLRAVKDAEEYAALKRCAALDDAAMQAAWAALKPGMTERQIADVVRARFAAAGGVAEFTIVGAGENGAFPHHHSSDRVLRQGDAVILDIGGRLGGYPSDMTRVAVIGEAPDGFDEVHGIVERAVQAALAAVRPGVPAKAVDKAARDVIAAAGYGEYFVHRTGHGVGIDIHEPPYITASSETVLREGMVFSIEPGIYLPGRFGVRLEEVVFLRESGPEILSGLTRQAYRAPA